MCTGSRTSGSTLKVSDPELIALSTTSPLTNDQQVLGWVSIAQLEMLAAFGEENGFRAVLDQVVAPKPKAAGG